jgi:glycosyltransferase involved in cell wall biosynthesis
MDRTPVALAHDYITQRGGAERVAAIMAEAFPGAPLYTTLYEPAGSFADFESVDVYTSVLNRVPAFRHDHRIALPLYAPVVSSLTIDADVLVASSSGWAHGFRCTGKKVVYCHAPARWLYQEERYLGADEGSTADRLRHRASRAALAVLGAPLRSWDQRKAATADRYLVNSSVIRTAVRDAYGIEAEVLAPPPAMSPSGPEEPIAELVDAPFVLCVARLLPYKNVDVVLSALQGIEGLSLAVVGRGPDEERLRALVAGDPSVHILGGVSEERLRWLYAHAIGLVAASYEDFGLTPLEAAAFGKPTAALHGGGYLDTIDPAVNGVFFEEPVPDQVADAVRTLVDAEWDEAAIAAHARAFGKERFAARLHEIVAQVG